jgi:hypothetical protein
MESFTKLNELVNSIKNLSDEQFEMFLLIIKEKDNLDDDRFAQVRKDLTKIYRKQV